MKSFILKRNNNNTLDVSKSFHIVPFDCFLLVPKLGLYFQKPKFKIFRLFSGGINVVNGRISAGKF